MNKAKNQFYIEKLPSKMMESTYIDTFKYIDKVLANLVVSIYYTYNIIRE